jgi:hypothetical protein
MQPLNRREGHSRRNCRPSLEGLETRDLLSVAAPQAHTLRLGAGGSLALGNLTTSTPVKPADPAVIQDLVNSLFKPVTTTVPIQIGSQVFAPGTYAVPRPTSNEVQRETFVERFVGRYVVGPPRFSNQASTIHIYSNGANAMSNQFLHSRSQIILFTPANPTAKPTTNDPVAGQVIGLVSAFPLSFLNSSSYLIMNVTNLPGVASNDPNAQDHGLPAHLALTPDPTSGGSYAGPQFTSTPPVQTNATTGQPFSLIPGTGGAVDSMNGTGLLDIQYVPDAHPRAKTLGSGKAIVTIQALVNTTGATSAIARQIN